MINIRALMTTMESTLAEPDTILDEYAFAVIGESDAESRANLKVAFISHQYVAALELHDIGTDHCYTATGDTPQQAMKALWRVLPLWTYGGVFGEALP